jgi:hypothetical protein
MVNFTNVKFVIDHAHKVYGKGNTIVAYQGEIKTMNNVLYVLNVNQRNLVNRDYYRNGVYCDVWKTYMLDYCNNYGS